MTLYRIRRNDDAYLQIKRNWTGHWTFNIHKAYVCSWSVAKSFQAIYAEYKTVKERI
jgi:hypothetical protein